MASTEKLLAHSALKSTEVHLHRTSPEMGMLLHETAARVDLDIFLMKGVQFLQLYENEKVVLIESAVVVKIVVAFFAFG